MTVAHGPPIFANMAIADIKANNTQMTSADVN